MTAQIAIMNKSAIALASDSAVSIKMASDHTSKTYNTVNKLFSLSSHAPVGIMIYGNSEFLRTPWETIIKVYRQRPGRRTFKTIHEYAMDFIDFLFTSKALFPPDLRDQALYFDTWGTLWAISDDINEAVDKHIHDHTHISESTIEKIIAKTLSAHLDIIYSLPVLKHIDPLIPAQILKNHRSKFEGQIREIFQKLPLTALQQMKLLWICANLPCRDYFDEHKSGVVIAGFGEEDVFPSLYSFVVQGNFRELIKYRPDKIGKTSQTVAAAVFPFAQSEMVGEFMEGCHPGQSAFILQYMEKILTDLPGYFFDAVGMTGSDEREHYARQFSEFSKGIMKSFHEDLSTYRRKAHIDPVINTVGMLPKDELAAMAGALVNLTRFRQRMSLDAETVGGPIDVAIISKGDGFVWINRKKYFRPGLNPHVFSTPLINDTAGGIYE